MKKKSLSSQNNNIQEDPKNSKKQKYKINFQDSGFLNHM